jgi:hypothetical protein
LNELKSDPLYVRLCQAQECFRARLTPKPWRCDQPEPPYRFPFLTSAAEDSFRQWEQEYASATTAYTTCRLIKQLGPVAIHPDIEPILSLHDQMACSAYTQQLA